MQWLSFVFVVFCLLSSLPPELLNQLDGFDDSGAIKVIAATNRPDVLDPALLRSGRLDRKIELPHPSEDARAQILRIHSRAMSYAKEGNHAVNFEEIARSTEGRCQT